MKYLKISGKDLFHYGCFKTKNSETLPLTVDNYENATLKQEPYYHKRRNDISHYAICPICGNPIIVVNLYNKNYIDKNTRSMGLHGRHFPRSVDGIAEYNNENYNNCPLHNSKSFGSRAIRNDTKYNEYLRQLVENNRQTIIKNIKEILGISYKNSYLEDIIATYLNNRYYQYLHTNEYNLPYSIIVTYNSLDIFGRYILNNDIGVEIKNAIIKNSKYFTVDNNNKITSEEQDFVSINIQLCNHNKRNYKWYAKIRIVEKKNNQEYIVFEKEIEVNSIILKP